MNKPFTTEELIALADRLESEGFDFSKKIRELSDDDWDMIIPNLKNKYRTRNLALFAAHMVWCAMKEIRRNKKNVTK